MARMLGRSRSLRLLRGTAKEPHTEETRNQAPPLEAFDLERLKAATPDSRADGRVETPEMLQRPKTSGGLGDRGKLFHKKVAPIIVESEPQAYKFPAASSPKPASFLYTAEVNEDQEGYIGLALGSPTMASPWNSTPRSTDFVTRQASFVTEITSQHTPPLFASSRQEAPKPKLSRWKSIFTSKKSPSQQEKTSFYQLAQAVTQNKLPTRADSHHDDEESFSLISEPISQADGCAQSPPTYKPNIRESRKSLKAPLPIVERPRARTLEENKTGKPKTTIIRTVTDPNPSTLPKVPDKDAPTVPRLVVSGGPQSTASALGSTTPLLDVEIPSIKMDRYSVMFGSVLQPSNRYSSLLARRQGADRLKPLNELSMKNNENSESAPRPHRRATSPSLRPKSPGVSLSLFPQPDRVPSPRVLTAHRPRPLQRSQTAPATSPSRPSFPKPLPESKKGNVEDIPSKPAEDFGMRTQLLTPTPSSRGSFENDLDEMPILVNDHIRPKEPHRESEWEILSKPQRNTASQNENPLSAPLEHARAADRAQTWTAEAKPRSASAVATIGVARSISVSRTQKPDMLKPTLLRVPTTGPERLVDRKPLTPTLVELQNRKSQRVQLVDA